MTDRDRPPTQSPRPAEATAAASRRTARLDAALRANLKRRKSQIRSRGLTGDDALRDTPSIVKASQTDRE